MTNKLYPETRRNYRMRRAVGGITLPKGEIKREYFGTCELCNKVIPEGKHKDYHHWVKDMPAMGIWVCYKCHKIIEGVDAGIVDIYNRRKTEIEKEYAMKCLEKIGIKLEESFNIKRQLTEQV